MSREALLARLARLDARDRAWLLGELPSELRLELLSGLTGEESSVAARVAPAQGWESLDAQLAAEALELEPVWLVSAATRGTDARWREHLLQHMPARRRHEIELADRGAAALNQRSRQLVLAACRQRIENGNAHSRSAHATGGMPRAGFAALVDHMRGRFA